MTEEVQQAAGTAPTESGHAGHGSAAAPEPQLTILLYASDRTVRENVRFTLGRRVAADLPPVRVLEVATQPAVPGGIGLCRQLKDEVFPCPPVLVLTGRRDDAWLATWSRADGVVPHPVDPLRLPEAVAALLRSRRRSGSDVVPIGSV
jgi:DNA-binding NarL/FixJ family response regulator